MIQFVTKKQQQQQGILWGRGEGEEDGIYIITIFLISPRDFSLSYMMRDAVKLLQKEFNSLIYVGLKEVFSTRAHRIFPPALSGNALTTFFFSDYGR